MAPLNSPPLDEIHTKLASDRARASNPGRIPLSVEKLAALNPQMCATTYFIRWWRCNLSPKYAEVITKVGEHLMDGDCRAAIVISTIPNLLIAAYTDEMDCVAILQFPNWLVRAYDLRPGSKLITVNTYKVGDEVVRDLHPGPRTYGEYSNFYPYIAEFLSDDMKRIEACKANISADEWERTWHMGKEYLRKYPNQARDGRPGYCGQPAEAL